MNENSGNAFDDLVRKSVDGASIEFNPGAWEELSAQLDLFDRAMISEKKSFLDKLKSWISLSLNSFFVILIGLLAFFGIVISAEGAAPQETKTVIEQFNEEVDRKVMEPEMESITNEVISAEPEDSGVKKSRSTYKKRTSMKEKIPVINEIPSSDSVPVKDTTTKKDVFIFW